MFAKKAFKCKLCGSDLNFYIVTFHNVVSAEVVNKCIEKDEFTDLYEPYEDKLYISCSNPDCDGQLYDDDKKSLEHYFEICSQ